MATDGASGESSFLERPALEIALGQNGMSASEIRRGVQAALAGAGCPRTVHFRLAAGTLLGPYEILQPVGAGGMGEIYRARDTRLKRPVAVKILAGQLMDEPGIRRRFEAEAQAISNLNHPHICTLYDIGRQSDIDYLVMEYLEGETLAERLKRGPLGYAEALRVAAEIASALTYAHAQGVIHRDLKPANIMLTSLGAKLLDFGLARWEQEAEMLQAMPPAGGDTSLTVTGLILGTPQYLAPEQIERRPVDARTDIFALGLVISEMCSGRKAFAGESAAEAMRAILTAAPPAIPGPLGNAARVCLAKSPAGRWQSAAELLACLEQLARAGSAGERIGARAFRLIAVMALLAAFGLCAGDAGSAIRQNVRFRHDVRFELLHSFPRSGTSGSWPASLAIGPGGTLYGTTGKGGNANAGAVFAADPPASADGKWNFRTLYTFSGSLDGADPEGAVTAGADGKLYGTTAFGGSNGNGTVYELIPPDAPGGAWTEKVLHHFLRRDGDGCDPSARLIFGRDGSLYGTTQNGGSMGQGNGTVFQLIPPATPEGQWTEKVLYQFTGGWDGGLPVAELIEGRDGNLYGTTSWGAGSGTVFQLAPSPSAASGWRLTVLYRFVGLDGEGNAPAGGLAAGPDGALYGLSYGAGGHGAVFRLSPPEQAGGRWIMTFLHRFTLRGGDASDATGTPILGPGGAIYGLAKGGGAWGKGMIFELQPPSVPGRPWTQNVLYSFSGASDGLDPNMQVWDGNRDIYGVALHGGAMDGGAVFKLSF